MRLILDHTPEIPLWPQLPKLPREGMVRQFLCDFPGLVEEHETFWVDTSQAGFIPQMTSFYEDYLAESPLEQLPGASRFGLNRATGAGFFVLEASLATPRSEFLTAKGQVTGPVTTGIGLKDQEGTPAFYHDDLRDMLIKQISMKARWQVEHLKHFTRTLPPLVFIDEPGMVSFSSTAFAGVSREMASSSVAGVITQIQAAGGLAGIHICANGDWGPPLTSGCDIISFDAYSYFDNFTLYREELVAYLDRGGILAWGIVPTGDPVDVARESTENLLEKWRAQFEALSAFGIDKTRLARQTLIAPACGTGSLSPDLAEKVLAMTAQLSGAIRAELVV
jgi:hypothetical protein